MTTRVDEVYGGVDTHGRSHHAAPVDGLGRVLGDREFPATTTGYLQLITWLRSFGLIARVGVEGTGSYGAGLAAVLAEHGVPTVEAIRALRVARGGAVKARTAALNQLHGLLVTAPAPLRETVSGLSSTVLVRRCAGFRVDDARLDDPTVATKAALRALARRIQALSEEVAAADRRLRPLTQRTAPRTTGLLGISTEIAGQLLVTAGDNPDRLRSEAARAQHSAGSR